jgi:hypothetical protein
VTAIEETQGRPPDILRPGLVCKRVPTIHKSQALPLEKLIIIIIIIIIIITQCLLLMFLGF